MIGQKGIPATLGGVETSVEHLSAALAQRGHRMIVYCRANYTPANASASHPNVELRILPSISTKHFDALSHTALSLIHLARKDADIVHLHSVGPAALAPLARFKRLPTVVTVHAADWLRTKWSAPARFCLRRALDLAVKSADLVTTVSLSMVGFLADTYGMDAVHIPNGVAPQPPSAGTLSDRFGISAKRFILFAGRMVPEKDVHVLIQAFNNLLARPAFADTHLLLAGDSGFSGNYLSELRRQAGPNTHFLGALCPADLALLYENAAVCVLPSHIEGMSLVLLEAASHCCPVIAADITENRNTLSDFARYFQPRNAQHLQDVLSDVLDNPVSPTKVEAARSYVLDNFSWDTIARRMEDAYQCVLSRP